MRDLYGHAGKILRVDLSSREITDIPTAYYADKFLGGRGIAAGIYRDEVAPEVKAFDAENRLIFALGPLAGFPVIGSSRWTVCGKSPAIFPEAFSYSNLGGYWGAGLKFAGYDAIVVQGKSDKPVYLYVADNTIEIRNASALWGKTSIEAREALKQESGSSTRVVVCGPAGENMVSFASLLADSDASGSSGFGAVMGSKKLKAIAVKGSGKVTAANPERFLELCNYLRELKMDVETSRATRLSSEAMSGYASKMKRDVCYGCIGACARMTYEAENGTTGKFACGSATFYGSQARRYYGRWNDVPFFATKLCDGYGLDTEVVFCLIMWLRRCHEAGILTDENTGLPLSRLGSLEFIETLVKKISLRDGFGEILAQGVNRAAQLVGRGTKEFITDYTSKDDRPMIYCPRMYIVSALLYALEPRLPIQQLHEVGTTLRDWLRWANKAEGAYLSSHVFREISRKFWGSELAVDFSTYDGKALAAIKTQNRQYVKESLILCDWMWPIISNRHSEDHIGDPTLESKLLSAVSGEEISEDELYKVGERIFNLQRAIEVREGHRGREYDQIPETLFTVPLKLVIGNLECLAPGKDGKIISRKGAVVDRRKFEKMKDEFYRLRGWDIATGLQTRAKLMELGLADVAEDLAQRGLAL